jgi:hypothetical protein
VVDSHRRGRGRGGRCRGVLPSCPAGSDPLWRDRTDRGAAAGHRRRGCVLLLDGAAACGPPPAQRAGAGTVGARLRHRGDAKMRRSPPTAHQSPPARHYQRARWRPATASAGARRAESWPPWHTEPTAPANSAPEIRHDRQAMFSRPPPGRENSAADCGDDPRPPVQPQPRGMSYADVRSTLAKRVPVVSEADLLRCVG